MTVMTLDELQKLPPLSEREKEMIEREGDVPTEDCPAMTQTELKEFRPWYDKDQKIILMDIDSSTLGYFNELSKETGVPSKNLMNLYLIQCAKEKKRPVFV